MCLAVVYVHNNGFFVVYTLLNEFNAKKPLKLHAKRNTPKKAALNSCLNLISN